MKNAYKQHFITYLKGLTMGAADVVPGVSGGTIALITHIYERLINAIDTISISLVWQLFTTKRKEAWSKLDGSFLLALALGIGTSILLVSGGISWLLDHHPIPLWAFFFGLILGSAFVLKNAVTNWNIVSITMVLLGSFIAFGIGLISPSQGSDNLLYLFFCGMLVVIAMILPGISGAFILILLGAYGTALDTVTQLKSFALEGFIVFAVMASGGLVGLKVFAKLLRWLFKHYKNTIFALMTGFLFGSLYKVWPWKEVTQYYTNSSGERVPLTSVSVLPEILDANTQVAFAVCAFLFGLVLLLILERLSKNKSHA
jgi:putative membrane protein